LAVCVTPSKSVPGEFQLMNHEVQRAVLAALDADPGMQAYMESMDTRVGG
jgi:hypothetical protein